jgi:hypothetical protein
MVDFDDADEHRGSNGNYAGSSRQQQEPSQEDHDYTENASAADIAQAIEQQREEEKALIGQNMEGAGVGDSGRFATLQFRIPEWILTRFQLSSQVRTLFGLVKRDSRCPLR